MFMRGRIVKIFIPVFLTSEKTNLAIPMPTSFFKDLFSIENIHFSHSDARQALFVRTIWVMYSLPSQSCEVSIFLQLI